MAIILNKTDLLEYSDRYSSKPLSAADTFTDEAEMLVMGWRLTLLSVLGLHVDQLPFDSALLNRLAEKKPWILDPQRQDDCCSVTACLTLSPLAFLSLPAFFVTACVLCHCLRSLSLPAFFVTALLLCHCLTFFVTAACFVTAAFFVTSSYNDCILNLDRVYTECISIVH